MKVYGMPLCQSQISLLWLISMKLNIAGKPRRPVHHHPRRKNGQWNYRTEYDPRVAN